MATSKIAVKKAVTKAIVKKPVAKVIAGKPTVKAIAKVAAKPVAKAITKTALKSVAGLIPGGGTAVSLIEGGMAVKSALTAGKPASTAQAQVSRGRTGKRKKGKVPKAVRKWATRIVSRRKQEEKIVKSLFGNDGGKLIKKPKKGSVGIITAQERAYALSK